jgi:hypothetical protein
MSWSLQSRRRQEDVRCNVARRTESGLACAILLLPPAPSPYLAPGQACLVRAATYDLKPLTFYMTAGIGTIFLLLVEGGRHA